MDKKFKIPAHIVLTFVFTCLLIVFTNYSHTTLAADKQNPVTFVVGDNNFSQATLASNSENKFFKLSIPRGQLGTISTQDSITIDLPAVVNQNSINITGGTGNETITQDGHRATLKFNQNLDLFQATQSIDFYIYFRITAQNVNQSYPISVSFNQPPSSYPVYEGTILTNTTNVMPSGTWIVGSGYQNDNLIFPGDTINSIISQDPSDPINKYATFSNNGPYVSGSAIYNIIGNEKTDNGAVSFKLDNNLDLHKVYMWTRYLGNKPMLVTKDVTDRVVYTSEDKRQGYINLTPDELNQTALQIGIIAKINDFSLPSNGEPAVYHMELNALYHGNPVNQASQVYDKVLNPNNGKFQPNIQLNYGSYLKLDVNSGFDFSHLVSINDVYDGNVTDKVTPTITKNGLPQQKFNPQEEGNYQFNYQYTNSQKMTSSKTIDVAISKYNPQENTDFEFRNLTLIAGPKTTWNYQDNIIKSQSGLIYYRIDDDESLETINTQIPGIHDVFYALYDTATQSISNPLATVTVNVLLSKAAISTQNYQLEAGQTWNPVAGIVSVKDACGESVPFDQVNIDGSVNVDVEGNYLVTYSYEDIAGNVVSSRSTVTVYRPTLQHIEITKLDNNSYIITPINSDNKRYAKGTGVQLPGFNELFYTDDTGSFLLKNDLLPEKEITGLAHISIPLKSNDITVTIPAKHQNQTNPTDPERPNGDNHEAQIQSGLVHYFTGYGVQLWNLTAQGMEPSLKYQPNESYVPYYGDYQIIDNIKYLHLANSVESQWIQAQYLQNPYELAEISFENQDILTAGNVPYNIFLRDSGGNMVEQNISPDTTWIVFAKKNFYGHTYYRIGNQNQWIEDTYVKSIA